jgi:hypothetical protein
MTSTYPIDNQESLATLDTRPRTKSKKKEKKGITNKNKQTNKQTNTKLKKHRKLKI